MQNDILPPDRLNNKNGKPKPMRSLRLQGHKLEEARQRLRGQQSGKPELTFNVGSEQEQKGVEEIELDDDGDPSVNTPQKSRFWHHWSRRRKILTGTAVVLLAGILVGSFLIFGHNEKPVALKRPTTPKVSKPTTVASPLTGLQVAPELAARPVTGVMIENSPDARPQSGMQDAGVVYEAIAEGGITRFIALFQDTAPQYVGPVRSLRPYFLDFAAPYQASIAHVGGSPDALSQVRNGSYRDIDQFFNSGSYWRVSNRYAPHNVYTSFEKLDALNKSKGYTSSKYTPWPRKADKPLATPTAAHIDMKISSPLYFSHYDYDKASNSYLRSEGGQPHMEAVTSDGKTTVQLRPKVVIALVMSYSIAADGHHSTYGDTGSGQMFVFQDGGVQEGTWTKTDQRSMFQFKDANGQPLALNAGQTWVTIISPGQVASTP